MRMLSGLFLFLTILLFADAKSVFCQTDSRDSISPYGVLDFLIWDHEWNYYHYDTMRKIEQSADLMKEAGIGFVRIDFLWADIEPMPEEFDFEKYDMVIDIIRKRGISVLGILHYNPLWNGNPWNQAPDAESYVNYAIKTVEHFKARVKYWEIWNEPDEPEYWIPQDGMKTYTGLLKKVYPAIKKCDPSCKILMGGISNNIPGSLEKIYNNNGKDYFDIVNIHPFVDPSSPDALGALSDVYKSVIDTMERYGDSNKSIWFTEIGCPGVKNPLKRLGWWFGQGPSEDVQSQWVDTIYSNCLEWPGVQKIFWAFFRDTDRHFKSAVDYFGLIRNDFSRKPAFYSYKKIAAD